MRALAASDFRTAEAPPAGGLGADEIHLCWLPAWQGPNRGAAESAAVRRLLGAYLGRDPAALAFERGAHGKPRLADGALEFNLAHSGGELLLGLSAATPLGVDLELPRHPRPVLELAGRYFDPDEAHALAALPDEAARQAAFLRVWACKEAVLKVDGGGISMGLDRVVFGLDRTGLPQGPLALRAPLECGDWQLLRLHWPGGACGALAWRGPQRRVLAWRMTSF